MKSNFLKELFARLISLTPPKFFRTLSIIAGVLVALIYGTEYYVTLNLEGFTIPESLLSNLTEIKAFLIGVFFSSSLTTTKAELQDNKTKENILKNS